jgi:hypothetical protein
MEMFKQPGRLGAPICTECGNEMTWVRSVLITAEQVIASRFICTRCHRRTETRVPPIRDTESR